MVSDISVFSVNITIVARSAVGNNWPMSPHGSGTGKGRINGLAIRQLALAAAAAGHSVGRMHELKIASHVCGGRCGEIGNDAARVVRNEVRRWPGIPVVGAAPSRVPTDPQRRDAVDRRLSRDLKILPAIDGAVAQR